MKEKTFCAEPCAAHYADTTGDADFSLQTLTEKKQTITVDASAESVFFKVAGKSAGFGLDYVID